MVKATLYIETKSALPLRISENSEVDLGFMSHQGCNSCANYCHKKLGLRYCRDLTSTSESYNSHRHFGTKTP